MLAVHIDRRFGLFKGARQGYADVGVARLARAVDHAAHHGHVHLLHPGIDLPPGRHHLAEVLLDFVGQLLKVGAVGTSAARTGGHLRYEIPYSQRLQYLLADPHLFGTVAAGFGRERYADGVAYALLQQYGEGRAAGHDAFHAHAGLGEAYMQRVVQDLGDTLVYVYYVLHMRHLAADDNLIGWQPDALGKFGRAPGALHHGIEHHLFG